MAVPKSVIVLGTNKEKNCEKCPLLQDEYESNDSTLEHQCGVFKSVKQRNNITTLEAADRSVSSSPDNELDSDLSFLSIRKQSKIRKAEVGQNQKKSNGNTKYYGGTSDAKTQFSDEFMSNRNINNMNRYEATDDLPGKEAEELLYVPAQLESLHCHDLSNEREAREKRKRKKAMRKLIIATVLCIIFMIGEVIGGYLASSLAVLTDASHLLTDVSSFLISILALKMAAKPTSKKMTFGWHRAEVIGALISVFAIWIVTGVLVYLAILRIVNQNYNVNGKDMLITAGIAVGFNIVMGFVLHEHGHSGHSHSNDHKHDPETRRTRKRSEASGNVNVRAAYIHVLGDLLQSLGVLIAALIIYFEPKYKIADPICTFLFSIFVLVTTVTILRDTMLVIMEGSPLNIDYNQVKKVLLEVDEVIGVHDLHLWSLTLNQTVMSAHLVIDPNTNANRVLIVATSNLKSFHDFHSLTLQVENYSDEMESCQSCKPTS